MSAINAGLPQPVAATTGSHIGDMQMFPEAGTMIYPGDGQEWLRTGLTMPVGNYPAAAQLEHLKVVGVPAINGVAVAVTQVADNGIGTIVAAYAHPTNVLVSVDYGASWAAVPHQITGSVNVTAVIWAGTRFILGGNSTACYLSYSVTGTAFTPGGSMTPGGTINGMTLRGAWNGVVALFIVQSSATNAAFSTVDGVTLTTRILPFAPTSQPAAYAAGSTIICLAGATSGCSTTDGVSFTALTFPTAFNQAAYLAGQWLFIASGGAYYTSFNLVTYIARTFPVSTVYAGGLGGSGRLTFDSQRIYMGVAGFPVVLWSTDGVAWKLRWISALAAGSAAWHLHAGKFLFPTTTTSFNVMRILDWNMADYVGVSQIYYPSGTASVSSPVGYVRLK